MRLRPREKDINLVNFDGDENKSEIFNKRIEFANNLTNLIKNIEDGITISIDAKWGEGKTLFLKLLERRLAKDKEQNIKVISFDAFKNDFFENPFAPIALEIQNKLNSDKEALEKFSDAIKNIAFNLYHHGGNIFLKIVTAGLVNKEDIDKLTDGVLGPESILLERQRITCEDYVSLQQSMSNLKTALEILVQKSEAKLVFIVDELDRCNPEYAIKVFEVIKHFFEVDGITFVLAMNKEQISKYFEGKCRNGAENYLQKFINFECVLPSDKSDKYSGDISQFTKKLFNDHLESIDKKTNAYKLLSEIDFEVIAEFFSYFQLTLREIEDFLRNLVITTIFYNGLRHRYGYYITAFFLILKIKHFRLFSEIKRKNLIYINNTIVDNTVATLQLSEPENIGFSYNLINDIPKILFKEFDNINNNDIPTLNHTTLGDIVSRPINYKLKLASNICKAIDLEL